jgi:AcrR family transcriptional regulator
MVDKKQPKGEVTRRHILDTAFGLFRRRGFEKTTMRDIAQAAELSLGAAYHYFGSKEDLVRAYYEWTQDEHERRSTGGGELRERVRRLLSTKLELLSRDRKLLVALLGNLGDPSHPLSVFGRATGAVRERSIEQFTAVFDDPAVPLELKGLLGRGLWLSHLGLFLFFVHDRSKGQTATTELLELIVDLASNAAPLLGQPLAASARARLSRIFGELEAPGAAS